MLAIFFSILETPLASSVYTHVQVATLESRRLITAVTSLDSLEAMKYRCAAPFDAVRAVANSVHFHIAGYLFDFV